MKSFVVIVPLLLAGIVSCSKIVQDEGSPDTFDAVIQANLDFINRILNSNDLNMFAKAARIVEKTPPLIEFAPNFISKSVGYVMEDEGILSGVQEVIGKFISRVIEDEELAPFVDAIMQLGLETGVIENSVPEDLPFHMPEEDSPQLHQNMKAVNVEANEINETAKELGLD